MNKLLQLAQNAQRLTTGRLFVLTFSDQINKDIIIQLNQEFQLELGILADDRQLPFYSEVSQSVYGKPNSRWTLKDTGEFYESFRVISVSQSGLVIDADDEKEDKRLSEYGAILGLNAENMARLSNLVIPTIRKYMKELMLK